MIPVQFLVSYKSEYFSQDIHEALETGCKWIQIRLTQEDKSDKIAKEIGELKALCRKHEAMLIVEGNNELAQKAETDGIYISTGNLDELRDARKTLGEGFIIGIAVSDFESIVSAKKYGADYVCIGSCGANSENASAEDYKNIIEKVHENGLNLPIVAYGDFSANDIEFLINSGVNGICLNASKNCDKGIGKTIKSFLEN